MNTTEKVEIPKSLSDNPVKRVKSFFKRPKKTNVETVEKSEKLKKLERLEKLGTEKKVETVEVKNDVVAKDSINDIKHRKKVHKGPKKIVPNEKKVPSSNKKEEKLFVIPLGGLDEIGKNMTLFQYRDEIVIVDAGIAFPDEALPGIDVVIPDYSYIASNKDKIKALLITHGHEDHIGGTPYLYRTIDHNVPMYGGKLALALAKSKFEKSSFGNFTPKMKEARGRSKFKIGKYFEVEFISVTHSIADAYAICIKTPAGKVLHTGDFKIDLTPVDGEGFDFSGFARLGDEGIDLLLSDSTNSELEGYTPSERSVGESIRKEFEKATGRIIIASFASHIYRLQQIINEAHRVNRKIAIEGRSMVKVFDIASKLGYLKLPEGIMVSLKQVEKLPDEKVVLLCTGTQGEPLAALSRIAKNMHKHIKIRKGDTVIISATPIPGNERAVYNNINSLLKNDADVVFKKIAGVHVSGHGSQDEQKLMLNLVRPKNFMPVHGDYKMLIAHKKTGMETGIPEERIIIATNGSRVEVTKSYVKLAGKVTSGITLVDGLGVGDIGKVVLRDRQQLAEDGVVIVVLTIDKTSGKLLAGPDIVTRGFVYSKDADIMINEAKGIIRGKILALKEEDAKNWSTLKTIAKDTANKFFYEKIKRSPIILPIVMEV
ncbi:ribonuclease J [Psychrilyobacter sp.]|uniref:ribonuclease J n=1 Tax=Psychrilyobacter sp. TaxID=2586924 RepID=UPI003019D196